MLCSHMCWRQRRFQLIRCRLTRKVCSSLLFMAPLSSVLFLGHIYATVWYARACGQRVGKSRRSHFSPSSGVRVCGVCGVYVCVTWCVHIHDLKYSCEWHDLFKHVTWITHMHGSIHLYTFEITHSLWFRYGSYLSPMTRMCHESASVLIESTWERKLG